jgi:hypothetical protein
MVKTLVMMLGEVDFGTAFAQDVTFTGIEGSAQTMPYPTYTLVFFAAFVLVMSIIVMNLLVRAVGNSTKTHSWYRRYRQDRPCSNGTGGDRQPSGDHVY